MIATSRNEQSCVECVHLLEHEIKKFFFVNHKDDFLAKRTV